tara:strand:+ start:217 stop:465 length:249 start_codon:yes stop_codon:yes gene_type:complete
LVVEVVEEVAALALVRLKDLAVEEKVGPLQDILVIQVEVVVLMELMEEGQARPLTTQAEVVEVLEQVVHLLLDLPVVLVELV